MDKRYVIIGFMLGVFIALGASLAWAGSSILLKYLSSRIDAIAVNTMRLWVGMIALIALVFADRPGGRYPAHAAAADITGGGFRGFCPMPLGIRFISGASLIWTCRFHIRFHNLRFPVLTLIAAFFSFSMKHSPGLTSWEGRW